MDLGKLGFRSAEPLHRCMPLNESWRILQQGALAPRLFCASGVGDRNRRGVSSTRLGVSRRGRVAILAWPLITT